MRIERVTDADEVYRGAELYDDPPTQAATLAFLAKPDHHLLYAYDDAGEGSAVTGGNAVPIGMVSGVETTHPDKGTEMFLYELSVAESARRRGVAVALVRALADLAAERGCYGMWVGVDLDNDAALATYRRAGAADEGTFAMLGWTFD